MEIKNDLVQWFLFHIEAVKTKDWRSVYDSHFNFYILADFFRRFWWLLCPGWTWRGHEYETSCWVTQFTIIFRWVPSVFFKRTDLCREDLMCTAFVFGNYAFYRIYCLPPKIHGFQNIRWPWSQECSIGHQITSWIIEWVMKLPTWYALFRGISGLEISTGIVFLRGSYASDFIWFMLRWLLIVVTGTCYELVWKFWPSNLWSTFLYFF